MNKIRLKKEPSLIAKLNSFPYQQEAFNAIKDLKYSAIFHEQGLGKTKIAIDLILYWLKNKDIDTVLVFTKKQLVQNWINEFKIHTDIKPSILTNNKRDNFFVFNGTSRVIVANFEIVLSEKERIFLFSKARNLAIIIDESTKLKNPESAIAKNFHSLSDSFKIKTIMTGTPIANRPYDIWSQIFFLDRGDSLGVNFSAFKSKTDLENELGKSSCKRKYFEDNVSLIFDKIKKFSIRETKNSHIITLPDKKYININAKFEQTQKKLYDKVKQNIAILIQKNDKVFLDNYNSILKKLLRLVQVASNPILIDEMYGCMSGKEQELIKIVDVIMEKNEKCIIWTSFIENVEYFFKKYSKYNPVKIHGGMKIYDRNKSVDKFKNDEYRILFATPQSSKEGLTLTMANHVIFYDRSFSLDDYLQAQDRIHRISQKKTCYVYNIILQDSIDIWIDLLLKAKQNAASLAQGDISKNEYQRISDYTFATIIKKILSLEH